MGKIKLKNEKTTMISFVVMAFVVLAASLIFLMVSVNKEELGGTILCSMLAFISGYAFFVFIARLIRYARLSSMQSMIIDENVRTISELQDRLNVSTKTVYKDVQFLMSNGYLEGYEVLGDNLINVHEERINRYNESRAEIIKEAQKIEEHKKSKKKKITSSKCPNCGAKVKFKAGEAECPYCGNLLNEE